MQQLALKTRGRPDIEQYFREAAIENNAAIMASVESFYLPLCLWLTQIQTTSTLVVGLNGAQGTGKSTLANNTRGSGYSRC